MGLNIKFWRLLTIGLISLTLLVLFPFLYNISINGISELIKTTSFQTTLTVTLLNALVSSIILVMFGFAGSLLLLKVKAFSFIGKNLSILIVPITLGNISIAFICKLLWGDTVFFSNLAQGSPINKLGFLLLLELYQYGLLFVYMFWLQLQNINADRLNFAKASGFSFYQKIKDIYLPYTRNLWLLLAAIAFVFTFYEESKIAYLFKVSQGTNSELITSWLNRNYQTNLLVNPEFAQNLIFDASAFVLVAAIAGLMFLFTLLYLLIKKITAIKVYPLIKNVKRSNFLIKKIAWGWGLLLIFIAFAPLMLSFTQIRLSFYFIHLGFPLLMTLIATLMASATAIFLGVASRLGWKKTLNSFSQKSLPFFVLLFVLLLVPSIVILITGYKWMSLIGYSSQTVIYIIWIIGHILLTLPILGSFVLFNHFRVSNNEIDYLQVYKLSKTETVKLSFFKRFKAEYLLLFIIGYSFIWNEAVLNNLFSDYIPSFVSGMKMLITGRGVDYDKAFGYLLVSFTVAILSAGIWRYIINKAEKQLNQKA